MVHPIILENKEFIESDCTGLKTSNAEEYMQFRYLDQKIEKASFILIDVKRKEFNLSIYNKKQSNS
ncbi:MAG: hypothetical protein QW578_08340 [Thermoplasmatales archaeon]